MIAQQISFVFTNIPTHSDAFRWRWKIAARATTLCLLESFVKDVCICVRMQDLTVPFHKYYFPSLRLSIFSFRSQYCVEVCESSLRFTSHIDSLIKVKIQPGLRMQNHHRDLCVSQRIVSPRVMKEPIYQLRNNGRFGRKTCETWARRRRTSWLFHVFETVEEEKRERCKKSQRVAW